jgi:hypothetical protein
LVEEKLISSFCAKANRSQVNQFEIAREGGLNIDQAPKNQKIEQKPHKET